MSGKLVTIYETTNDDLQEIYVGWTTDELETLMRRHCDSPPPAIRHWKKGQRISYRTIDFSFPAEDVEKVLDRYTKTAIPKGWKLLVDQAPA